MKIVCAIERLKDWHLDGTNIKFQSSFNQMVLRLVRLTPPYLRHL